MVVQTMKPLCRFVADSTTSMASPSPSFNPFRRRDMPKSNALGILAFEAAKTMSRLLFLYRSLSDVELEDLRLWTLRSRGVSHLISTDEPFLLNLAGLELLEELEYVASSVSRLSRKCLDVDLARFDLVYSDLKKGYIGIERTEFSTRKIDKVIEKVEKLTSMTANLYAMMETLSEMEVYEKKLQRWKNVGTTMANNNPTQSTNFELFENKISFQRKQVKRYMELSLWNVTFDKCTAMTARIVCIIYTRIQTFFMPFASGISRQYDRLPKQLPLYFRLHPHKNIHPHPEISFVPVPHRNSGPIIPVSQQAENPAVYANGSNYSTLRLKRNRNLASGERMRSVPTVYSLASETTVGGAGLTMRYANVVVLAGRVLDMMARSSGRVDNDVRRELFELLPEGLREKVTMKLRRMKRTSSGDDDGGQADVKGWREGVEGIIWWLADVARDTLRWQEERRVEKPGFEDDGGSRGKKERRVMLVQTLHFADLDKTEAAIIDVLVGLSCICRKCIE